MEIKLSTLAKRQLNEILDYVEGEYGSQTARKMLQKMVKGLQRLLAFPESGVLDSLLSTDRFTVRHLLIAPNVFYYICTDDAIVIGAIMHTKQAPHTISATIKQFLDNPI